MREVTTSVPSTAGDLRAIVGYPTGGGTLPGQGPMDEAGGGTLPGLVLVDGAGPSAAGQWGEQPAAFGGCGAVTLTHDKPGCGGSPGDWRDQDLNDRASDTLAALAVLREQPGVDPDRVGLLGISQGGWVSYLAASRAPAAIRHLVVMSGPGVTGFEQERYRIGRLVNGDPEALAWVDERARLLTAGADPAVVSARQERHAGRPWYQGACEHYGPDLLPFYLRLAHFDPADVFPLVRCPVFAAFGGADASVPVGRSVEVLNERLPRDPRHALAVFPGADHALMLSPWDRAAPYAPQLAPGFLPMLTAWLVTN